MARENVPAIGPVSIRYPQQFSAGLFDSPERPSDRRITRIRLRPIGGYRHALDPSKRYVSLGKPNQEMIR
jgi:hypothetical protein